MTIVKTITIKFTPKTQKSTRHSTLLIVGGGRGREGGGGGVKGNFSILKRKTNYRMKLLEYSRIQNYEKELKKSSNCCCGG